MERRTKLLIECHIRRMVSILIPLLDASKTDIDAFLAVMKANAPQDTPTLPKGVVGSSGCVPDTGSTFQSQNKTKPRSLRCPRPRRLIFSSHSFSNSKIESHSKVVDDDDDDDDITVINKCSIADASLSKIRHHLPGRGEQQINQNGNIHAREPLLRTNPIPRNEIERLPTLSVDDGRRVAEILDAEYGS